MAKLDKKTRDSLKDSDFGIPSKRMYPIHDKEHVEAAVKLFGHASNEDKPELAHNILRKAKEFGMDSSGWTQVNEWAKKYNGKNTNESATEGITESFSSNKQETLHRIRNKCIKGLKKIISHFEDGTMDITTFMSIWTSVIDQYQSRGNVTTYVGYRMRDDFIRLKHLLKKAIRNREQFDDNEIQKMESAYDEVKAYIKLCDSCYTFFMYVTEKRLYKHEKEIISSSKKIVSSLESLNPFEKKLNIIDMNGIEIPSSEKTITPILGKQKTDEKYDESSINEAATGASLLTVKNQLMRMVGNAFKFIGGSLVPKFTMQSTEKPEVAIDVNTNGQNVEVTPKYNGVADTLHKKKGIAFMRAAEVIADYADKLVNSFNGPKPVGTAESYEYKDEIFEALLEYSTDSMDNCELEAYLYNEENIAIESTVGASNEPFFISIGEDRLYDMEDFNAYFEGSEYMEKENDIYFTESEYAENNPFTLLLENHGYNKNTNSIDIRGNIKDNGIFGRPDVQNVLNRFMKENDDVVVTI